MRHPEGGIFEIGDEAQVGDNRGSGQHKTGANDQVVSYHVVDADRAEKEQHELWRRTRVEVEREAKEAGQRRRVPPKTTQHMKGDETRREKPEQEFVRVKQQGTPPFAASG